MLNLTISEFTSELKTVASDIGRFIQSRKRIYSYTGFEPHAVNYYVLFTKVVT